METKQYTPFYRDTVERLNGCETKLHSRTDTIMKMLDDIGKKLLHINSNEQIKKRDLENQLSK